MPPNEYRFIVRLMDLAPIAGLLHEVDGTVVYANKVMCDVTGYTLRGFLGKSMADLLGPGARRLQEISERCMRQGVGCFRDVGIMDSHGNYLPMRALCLPLEDENGEVTAMSCMMCRMDSVRKLELFFLQHMGKTSTDNYWILDEDGLVLHCEVDQGSLFHEGVAIGHSILEVIHPDHVEQLKHDLKEIQRRPGVGRRLHTLARRRKENEHIEFDAVYVPDEAGDRYYITSRVLNPSGDALVDRMIEAWGVDSDGELAALLKVDRSTISKWRRDPTRADKGLLATYRSCAVSVEWLETGRGFKFIST